MYAHIYRNYGIADLLFYDRGGALDVHGNTAPNAEFNFFADPYAARQVLIHSNLGALGKIRLFPLDITTKHTMSFQTYSERVDPTFPSDRPEGKTPLIAFTSAFLKGTEAVMSKFNEVEFQVRSLLLAFGSS